MSSHKSSEELLKLHPKEDKMDRKKSDVPTWYNPKGLNHKYGFSRSRQSVLRANGVIPYHQIGHYIFYKECDIDAWIDEHKMV